MCWMHFSYRAKIMNREILIITISKYHRKPTINIYNKNNILH